MNKEPAIYILANEKNGTVYTGVTSNLPKRIAEHKAETYGGFTKEYYCKLLVYYEFLETMEAAILRENKSKAAPEKRN